MKTLTFSVSIAASPERVWQAMLEHGGYEQWTAEFCPGSTYEGRWEAGERIRFLSQGGDGMSSEIAACEPQRFVSIRHLGMIQGGVEDTTSPAAIPWASAYENYMFTPEPDGSETRVEISTDVPPEYEEMMRDAWPRALQTLTALCESSMPWVTVDTTVRAPLAAVWEAWISPDRIAHWCTASPDWGVGAVENDVRLGGRFRTQMMAKDGSAGFDFCGEYAVVAPQQHLRYVMDDGRRVDVRFHPMGDTTYVSETFEAESQNPVEMQRQGWQAILENFRAHVESSMPA